MAGWQRPCTLCRVQPGGLCVSRRLLLEDTQSAVLGDAACVFGCAACMPVWALGGSPGVAAMEGAVSQLAGTLPASATLVRAPCVLPSDSHRFA